MLVLTCRQAEQIWIGNEIVVTVVEVNGHRVKLGIDAPKDIRILRSELKSVDSGANVSAGPQR